MSTQVLWFDDGQRLNVSTPDMLTLSLSADHTGRAVVRLHRSGGPDGSVQAEIVLTMVDAHHVQHWFKRYIDGGIR